MNGNDEMGLIGDNFNPGIVGRLTEEEHESKSVSENFDVGSGDDLENVEHEPPRKKKYHRHTPNQIQELEGVFKECPHPDEKQRLELSRRLGLETRQIKFWFQNRRTQMKTQLERHENAMLRQDNDKLRAENDLLKEAMRSPICNHCGGPALPGEVSYEQQQLRIENARLKDELGRICALANKFLGRPILSSASPTSNPRMELGMERSMINGLGTTLPPMGFEFGEVGCDRSHVFVDLALTAMDELIKMASMDGPLWMKSLDGDIETLNYDEYRNAFVPCIGPKPAGFVSEASRESRLVIINSFALVETLMDANRWAEMFLPIIGGAITIDVISNGTDGTKSGALQMMQAEFQVLSPLVPIRQVKFLRFCKQHAEGVWAVVDVSVDINPDGPDAQSSILCRRLPSGCIVQDLGNDYSKVTWIEHSEYDESAVHELCRPLLSSRAGLGARRWIATLQRQCKSFAIPTPSSVLPEDHTALSAAGKKSMLKLAQRMTHNFYSGICASSIRKWEKLLVGNVSEDLKILTRKNVNDPGEPSGVLLSAATSVWVPVAQQRLFEILRDERTRSQWDILSNGGPMDEVVRMAKSEDHGNCVSLLRTSMNTEALTPKMVINALFVQRSQAIDRTETSMLILQETWSDPSGAVVVYAPVDLPSLNVVMNGGDSSCVALLPSGFAILPCSPPNRASVKAEAGGNHASGCILTVGFQILVNSLPNAKLTVESIETVNNLISCTIQKIRTAIPV